MLQKIEFIRDQIWLIQAKTRCQQNLSWMNTILYSMLDQINQIMRQIPKDQLCEFSCQEENNKLKDEIRVLEMVIKKQEEEVKTLEKSVASQAEDKASKCTVETIKKTNSYLRTQLDMKKEEIKCLRKTLSLKESASACLKNKRLRDQDDCDSEICKLKDVIDRKNKEICSLKKIVESERASALNNAECLDHLKRKYLGSECPDRSKEKYQAPNESRKECMNKLLEEKDKLIARLELEICELKNKNRGPPCFQPDLCEAQVSRDIGAGCLKPREDSCTLPNNVNCEMDKTNFKLKIELERQKKAFELAKQHQEEVVESLLDKVNEASQDIQKKENRIYSMIIQQRKYEESILRLKEDVESMKATLEKSEKDHQQGVQCLEYENGRLSIKNTEIQDKLYKTNNKFLEKTMELNCCREKNKNLEQKLECLSIDISRFKTILKQSASCIAEREKQIQSVMKDLHRETSKSNTLLETLQTQNEVASAKEEEICQLKEWLARCEDNLTSLQNRINQRVCEEQQMNSSLEMKRSEIKEIKSIINTMSTPQRPPPSTYEQPDVFDMVSSSESSLNQDVSRDRRTEAKTKASTSEMTSEQHPIPQPSVESKFCRNSRPHDSKSRASCRHSDSQSTRKTKKSSLDLSSKDISFKDLSKEAPSVYSHTRSSTSYKRLPSEEPPKRETYFDSLFQNLPGSPLMPPETLMSRYQVNDRAQNESFTYALYQSEMVMPHLAQSSLLEHLSEPARCDPRQVPTKPNRSSTVDARDNLQKSFSATILRSDRGDATREPEGDDAPNNVI